jgi:hypothetical protein
VIGRDLQPDTLEKENEMSIKCGSCGGRHESIADVRACSEHYASGAAVQDVPTTTLPDLRTPQEEPRASGKQVDFMLSLESRKLPEDQRHDYAALEAMTLKAAKARITHLLTLPNLPGTRDGNQPDLPDVPAGRYACEMDGTWKFYQVDRPTEGRWAGYTFLKVQASDELYNIKNRTQVRMILDLIARDPKGSMLEYGRRIGRCGHCHRTLTDSESIAAGIGPICAGKMGW